MEKRDLDILKTVDVEEGKTNEKDQLICLDVILEIYRMVKSGKMEQYRFGDIPFDNLIYNFVVTRYGFSLNCSNGKKMDFMISYKPKCKCGPVAEDDSGKELVYCTTTYIIYKYNKTTFVIKGVAESSSSYEESCGIEQMSVTRGQTALSWEEFMMNPDVLFSKKELTYIKNYVAEFAEMERAKESEAEEIRKLALEMSAEERKELLNKLGGKKQEV